MIHTYKITGMTCHNCLAKVKGELLKLPEVLSAVVSLDPGKAVIEMSHHIPLKALQKAISPEKKYIITEEGSNITHPAMEMEEQKSWIETYKPLFLIFAYITAISFVISFNKGSLEVNIWMNAFMAGFFLTFSFFKLLDLKGFADGYATYDLLAKRWNSYGFVYPFIELFFGIALITGFNPIWIYGLILAVMGFSTLGVVNSLMKKQTIQCACLGTIFKLPLGTVTLFEDLLMVLMSAIMLIIMQ